MNNNEIEKQIKQMLDKFQQSNFTNDEARRCIAEVMATKLKKYIKEDEGGRNNKGKVA